MRGWYITKTISGGIILNLDQRKSIDNWNYECKKKIIIIIPPPPPPIIKRFEIMEWIVDSIYEGVIHHQYHKRMHRFKSWPKKVALALCQNYEVWEDTLQPYDYLTEHVFGITDNTFVTYLTYRVITLIHWSSDFFFYHVLVSTYVWGLKQSGFSGTYLHLIQKNVELLMLHPRNYYVI